MWKGIEKEATEYVCRTSHNLRIRNLDTKWKNNEIVNNCSERDGEAYAKNNKKRMEEKPSDKRGDMIRGSG